MLKARKGNHVANKVGIITFRNRDGYNAFNQFRYIRVT